jgi:hypothetical protein
MKTATTSISKILGTYGSLKFNFSHAVPQRIYDEIGAKAYDKLYKVLFVRNPYDRMVSFHAFQVRIESDKSKCLSFKDFVVKQFDSIQETPVHTNIQWPVHRPRLMSDYLTVNNKVMIDFLGRFEKLKQDTNRLLLTIGVPRLCLRPLGHFQKSPHAPFQEMYDRQTQDLVYKAFYPDFLTFGYKYELPT